MENHNTTPETDANAECDQEDGSPFAPVREWVHADFARRLERERDFNRRLYETECKDHAFMHKTLERVSGERDEARKLAKEYRDAYAPDDYSSYLSFPWENDQGHGRRDHGLKTENG